MESSWSSSVEGRVGQLHSIRSRDKVAVLVCMVLIASAVSSAPGDEKPVRAVTPSEIKWSAVPGYPSGYSRAMLEGDADKAGPHTYRVRLPAGFKIQPHTHAADEHVTVLQGTWSVGVGDTFEASRLRSFPVGSFVVVPAGTPHFLSIESETIVQVHGVGPIGFRLVGDDGSATRH
jgi:mannose-6-phosphate isomerase-like protein (cupin superfamily)